MHILPFTDSALSEALAVLKAGGVIAHATETCYGLACDLTNPAAVAKLFAIKQRPADQPVSALFPSVDEAKKYVTWNGRANELANKHLPGPLTLILPLRPDAPHKIFPISSSNQQPANQHPSIGIRVSSHPLAQKLVTYFGKPLSTTSANLHGKPNPYSAADIAAQFDGAEYQPDLILDAGTLPKTSPSTVVDLAGGSGMLLREGDIKNVS